MLTQEQKGVRTLARALGVLFALLFLSLPSSSAAQQITFTSAVASWRDAQDNVPGSQPSDPVITNGIPTSSVSWGGASPQSGYDVTITIPDPMSSPVADFTHRNFTVPDPSLTSIVLDMFIGFEIDGVPTGPLTFTYTFNHVETPNNLDPCPYPTPPGEGCTDRVTFVDAPDLTTFTVGGKIYTLGLTFLDAAGNPVEEFITSEGGVANTAELDVAFELVPPVLEVTKSGPVTVVPGQFGLFTIDVRNTGPNDAWDTTMSDVLPDGATGGMCDSTPQVSSARVFAANGVTPVPGKGPLLEGADFALSYAASPTCELTLTMLSAAAVIGEDERLIITYQTQLDAGTQGGVTLTNVAGSTEWFDDDASNPDRGIYTRLLSDGTVGLVDHEDAHDVATGPLDYLFEKTVVDPVSGNPLTLVAPGDTLRHRLRLENRSSSPLSGLAFADEIDRLNGSPLFEPGSLTLVTVPAGADPSGTDPNGGVGGTGIVDVRNLSVAAGSSVLVEFDVTLVSSIPDGTLATNQADLLIADAVFGQSDDPGVNGAADPFVDGDEDPTVVTIGSSAVFRVEKVSTDLDGDPAVLRAGETLRYTITVRNVGDADATDAVLRDAIPALTTYVAGSTLLNGIVQADVSGVPPFSTATGLLLWSPDDPTPGVLLAAGSDPGRTATLTFDVVVDPAAADGTIISNQAFVSAVAGGISDQPSDDPGTSLPDDPTLDVVGNNALLFAPKIAMLLVDNGAIGVVDPGDVLRYTIDVYNNGVIDATEAVLVDNVPVNTTYLADTVLLNGLPIGQPDGGSFPLGLGIPISSSDLTPPAPGPPGGVISVGERATVTFDLEVNAGVPGGTLITNQARVLTLGLPDVLTDGDGNPATGPEPTIVIVGAGQQLAISKDVNVVGGGLALAGSRLEYIVRVTNIGTVAANDVVLTDDLDQPLPGEMTYVPGTATLDGSNVGVTVSGSVITADYSTTNGPLPPGAQITLRFQVDLDMGLAMAAIVTNTGVVQWNAATQMEMASVSFAIGGTPGVGALNGSIWHDRNFDRVQDSTERALGGWIVELDRNGQLAATTMTDSNGTYRMTGIAPNDLNGDAYEIRFRAPDAGPDTAALGRAESAFSNDLQSISALSIPSGSNLQNLDLPIDPQGVVYQALQRTPVSGAMLSLLDAASRAPVSSACFDDPNQQGQVTGSNGYYKFHLNFLDASCPSGGDYVIEVAPPGTGFSGSVSAIIPPLIDVDDPLSTAFSVATCSGDAIPATGQYCEIQASEFAPSSSADTGYHLLLTLDDTLGAGSSQAFNNHIPLDPDLGGAVAITKTTPAINVSRGELVPYEITFTNQGDSTLTFVSVRDVYPAAFRYIEGSARVDGVETEPLINGRELVWPIGDLDPLSTRKIVLLLAVGAGATEGEFVNRAQAFSSETGLAFSGEASATVRVVPDPTFDCTDVIGKVFDDRNRDGVQDEGELGLPGVRLMTVRGLAVQTDQHGRFHITCAVVPNETRGSNFVMKLDDRTLPSGYRMSTRQTQVKRATRGKALRFKFGASIARVIGLDMADAVFEPGTTKMRSQWTPRIEMLLDELEKGEAILRLSYLADIEAPDLVDRRLETVEKQIREAWKERGGEPLNVETEIFWRSGSSPGERKRAPETSLLESRLPHVGAGPPVLDPPSGQSGERHLSMDSGVTEWSTDPELLATEGGDRLEEREVTAVDVEIIKLKDVVPPIHFESGEANIPADYVEKLRAVLIDMHDLENVRLHLVGHSDDEPLSARLGRLFGDNEGLSRERAGQVAELLQSALALPPESVSFAWAGDAQPMASNATAEGRALNRRVEVEVWYDELGERSAIEEVVVPQNIKRFKVCRTETVCKLRYREGHERRARIKNLIPPLDYGAEIVDLPDEFLRQIQEGFFNLRDKQNVTVKFIAHTDDVPLTGRAQRIYGNHLAISKARAHRVALEVKDALDLPTSAIASEGRGASLPVASNATPRGRALNRRIEVEFWHDDPLLELSDEFQICPDPADAEIVTRVYDPPWGRLEPLLVVGGEAKIPSDYPDQLRRAMADVADEEAVRLRFIGYTENERLSRRDADVYGDDIGLSAARARRTMERIQKQLELGDAQVEHEGRGFIHSEDLVNGGFLQGDTSHVIVQVVYDELAVMDDYDGIEVTPITRELKTQNPLALNLMRITVDGEPIDDPGRSSADTQRCTDVALDETDIAFRFDDLRSERRLSVTAERSVIAEGAKESVRFRMYNNYPHYIERAEVRIFELEQSLRSEPLALAKVDRRGFADWQPTLSDLESPIRPLKFVLRVYGEDGRFDETAPQSLWLTPERLAAPSEAGEAGSTIAAADAAEQNGDSDPDPDLVSRPPEGPRFDEDALLGGYGVSEPSIHNIEIGSSGAVQVNGSGIPPNHTVWLAGTELPVDDQGNFVGEAILPAGVHTVEIAVLDEEGNGELFLRDLELEKNDWFIVGIADITLSQELSGDRPDELDGNNATKLDSFADGRLAFFANGKFGKDWKLTASADTREGPIEDLFSNFLDKSPESLFRRLDPDYYYPTFGDESTIEELAPTLGKFYVKLNKGDDHLLWGNFTVRYANNELALVERGLYGANGRYQSDATTSFGDRRFVLDAYAADPGTVPSRDEFRGTGGSVYFLKRQDILVGSDRVRIEIRDKVSGLVSEVISLQPQLDYDIDYLQGRVLLSEPLSAIADDRLLVRNDGLSGNDAVLVVQYEYTPGFDELNTLNVGGQAHAWLTDFMKLGVTASRNDENSADSSLYAADLTLRKTPGSWVKVQASRSSGLVSSSQLSGDGGFSFVDPAASAPRDGDAYGFRVDVSVELADWLSDLQGRFSVYGQRLEAGYSAPGLNALSETDQYGGVLRVPLGEDVDVVTKVDRVDQDRGLETTTAEVNVEYALTESWSVQAGARHDERSDDSPSVADTQDEGDRTDTVLQVDFDPKGSWTSYAFGQATVQATGDRDKNNRGGVGGTYRLNNKLAVDGEVSHGNIGPSAELGTTYQRNERTKLYMNYALDTERRFDGTYDRRGSLTAGTRSRLTDSASVYVENQYQHANVTGLTRSMGVSWAPTSQWDLGVNWEDGTTHDRDTNAETERRAGGLSVGYHYEGLSISSGFEYIYNDTEQSDASKSHRSTWLLRNNLKFQMNEDGRLLAKFNYAISDSSDGDVFDGGFTEAVLGYAYRPVEHDRFDALVKYTYFYNVPTTDQTGQDGTSSQFIQKSHVVSVDLTYDLTAAWTIGTKYAYRLSQVSLDREDTDFFDNDAHLYIVRADWRFLKNWESSVEGRFLHLPDIDEHRAGALYTLYRYFGEHFKVGLGYNFTDFSEDLTDLSYDHHGLFLNMVGTF